MICRSKLLLRLALIHLSRRYRFGLWCFQRFRIECFINFNFYLLSFDAQVQIAFHCVLIDNISRHVTKELQYISRKWNKMWSGKCITLHILFGYKTGFIEHLGDTFKWLQSGPKYLCVKLMNVFVSALHWYNLYLTGSMLPSNCSAVLQEYREICFLKALIRVAKISVSNYICGFWSKSHVFCMVHAVYWHFTLISRIHIYMCVRSTNRSTLH